MEAEAGRGGMGIVYRATQVALGRPVALKLIAANFAGDRSFRERFKREWETAASIDHPNVIPVYEAGEADEHLFIAMRYVEGLDLANLLAREPELAPDRAVRIIAQVAAALDAAHARGLVHRDVKPANVLIGAEEHVYLTDFGLTKHASQDALTKTGLFVGSVDYAAPEQIRGEAMDARTDVYSLGCVLYQALTKRLPYDKPADMAKMYAHVSEPPPVVTEARPDAPLALDAVVAKAMAKEPDDRYQSAGDLARAAQAALMGGSDPSTQTQHKKSRSARNPIVKGSDPSGGEVSRRTKVAIGIALPTILVAGLAAAGLAASGVIGGGDDKPAAKAAVAATATATAQAGTPAQPPEATPAPPTGDPKAVATIKVGKGPDGVAVSGGQVFVANQQAGTLSVIDPEANKVVGEPIKAGTRPDGVVAGKGVVWLASAGSDAVSRFQAAGEIVPTAKVPVGDRPEAISLGKQLVWVANVNDNTVNRIDRAAPAIVGAPIGVGSKPSGIFVGRRFVWVANNGDDTVTRIDPSTAQVIGKPIAVGSKPRGVIETVDAAWIANSGDGTVTRLDRKTGAVLGTTKVGNNPRQLAFGNGFVWVTNHDDNSVTRLDPTTGRVVGSPIAVGQQPLGIASGAGAVWVANHADHTITRIAP
ncbi:serine/threonine-protein kinase [Solirubrobacter ginsenosidimutans]|uniref:non-specific serine/threonine protein kinase n=1 Tax=Solirubrobacter ginsenosidimutans TaxID=490573 RepID=A0A9X3MYP7_9ACTN|nr:serine/threonine-protein kinase [Solirubrobacter ginsenosidimutans]